MGDSIRLEVRGGPELRRHLNQLAEVEVKKIIRRAMRAGAKVILPQARANAPVGASGVLRNAIKIRAAKRSRRYVGINVTLAGGFFKGDAFYGAFQEFGWKTGKRRSSNRKAIPGKHFLQQAADAKGQAAGKRTVQAIWQGIKARALMRGGLGGGQL